MSDCSLTGSIFRFTRSLAILQHQPTHPTEISFLLKSKPIHVSSYHTRNYTLNSNQGLCITLHCYKVQFNSVHSLSHAQLFVTPWTAVCQASLSITNSRNLLKLMSIKSVTPSNHFILLSSSHPIFNLSQHQGLF